MTGSSGNTTIHTSDDYQLLLLGCSSRKRHWSTCSVSSRWSLRCSSAGSTQPWVFWESFGCLRCFAASGGSSFSVRKRYAFESPVRHIDALCFKLTLPTRWMGKVYLTSTFTTTHTGITGREGSRSVQPGSWMGDIRSWVPLADLGSGCRRYGEALQECLYWRRVTHQYHSCCRRALWENDKNCTINQNINKGVFEYVERTGDFWEDECCRVTQGHNYHLLYHHHRQHTTVIDLTIGTCIYMVIITITTVGYGDVTPKTTLGRHAFTFQPHNHWTAHL